MSYYFAEFQDAKKLKALFKNAKSAKEAFKIDFENALSLQLKHSKSYRRLRIFCEECIERLYLKRKSFFIALEIEKEALKKYQNLKSAQKMLNLLEKEIAEKDFIASAFDDDLREFSKIAIERFYDI